MRATLRRPFLFSTLFFVCLAALLVSSSADDYSERQIGDWVFIDDAEDNSCYGYKVSGSDFFLIGLIYQNEQIKFWTWVQNHNWPFLAPVGMKSVNAKLEPGGRFILEMHAISDEEGNGFKTNFPIEEASEFLDQLPLANTIVWSFEGDEIAKISTETIDVVIGETVACMERQRGMSFGFDRFKIDKK